MSDTVTVYGRITDGQMALSHRQRLLEVTRAWPEGTEFEVRVRRHRARISDLQRAYWWAVIVPMVAEQTGDDEDSTHEDLKRVFKHCFPSVRKVWRNKKTGKRRQLTRRLSLTDLNTKQMTELIDSARKWAGEFLGVEIPPPDPAWRERAA
jgi:hypothetical protein